MSISIVKGRDKEFTIRIYDQFNDPVDITGWNIIKARFLKTDGSILEKYAPLSTAINEVQKISFNTVPDSGTWKIKYENESTVALAFNCTNTDVQTALNNLQGLDGLVVTGNFTAGFTISFAGASGGRDQSVLSVIESTLKTGISNVEITVSELTKGIPQSGIDVLDETSGKIKVVLSEEDTALLQDGQKRDFDLLVRIGTRDLPIPPQYQVLDVKVEPFTE